MKKEKTLREHLAAAGRVTSEKKAAASRENGKKGGRPPSNLTEKCIYCSKPRDEMFRVNVCHICDAF